MSANLLVRGAPAPRAARPSPRPDVLLDLDKIETYPPLSDSAARVTALVDEQEPSVAEVAGLVRRDGVLAALVLRAANTGLYRGRKDVGDVQQAVLRLGLAECGRLLCAVGVRGLYDEYPAAVRRRCDALLRHSLFVARLASGLGQVTNAVAPGAAFAAGLLHDIGRLVITVRCPAAAAEVDPVGGDETPETLRREREAFGIDHCAVGHQFAVGNNLPEGVARVALNHHRPAAEELRRELVALVAVADRVVNHVQRAHNIRGYDPAACPHFAVLARGWPEPRKLAFRTALPAQVVRAMRDTRAMLRSCT